MDVSEKKTDQTNQADINQPMPYDDVLVTIADYVVAKSDFSKEAYQTAKCCLLDTLGCGIYTLNFPAATRLLGPIIKGTVVPNGVAVIGTQYVLDPVLATFNMGLLNRWLDYNDTWLAAEWGHPSDNISGILSSAMYISNSVDYDHSFTMHELLTWIIKAYEIQGVLALDNSFNAVGIDHVILVKIATCAIVTRMLGGSYEQVLAALSQCWVDGQSLRTYRHAPNAGSRKSWAAGDASARGVQLALWTLRGEIGYPTAISAPSWGFSSVNFNNKEIRLAQPLSDYVMENILFKVKYPAEFHAQTAIEAAINLHQKFADRLDDIESIAIGTHEAAIRIISKSGPLNNPADRDHCLQYMIAVALVEGTVTAEHYEDDYEKSARVDVLREKMIVKHNAQYSKDYMDSKKRSIANSIQLVFKDGSSSDLVEVEYPLGHRSRRAESREYLIDKFKYNIGSHYSLKQKNQLIELWKDDHFHKLVLADFLKLWLS